MTRTLTRVGVSAGLLSIAVAGSAAAGAKTVTRPHVKGKLMHATVGKRPAVVKGTARPGAVIRFQVLTHGRWATLGKDTTSRHGWFRVSGRTSTPLSAKARITTGGHDWPVGRLNVYRYAEASWYGPGLYGGHLACGGTLTPGTQGVANKYLPCGTKVTLRNGKHTVRVPVVDRGPYSGNREYDLTAATAQKLHFSGAHAILTTK